MSMMELYQHDGRSTFRFVLRGSLAGRWVQELEYAWVTASSVLKGKEVVVDVCGVAEIDEHGVNLLSRMRAKGVRLVANTPPESPVVADLMGIPAAQGMKAGPGGRWWRRLRAMPKGDECR
jgi:ABC-type transporter Mla MlaB component